MSYFKKTRLSLHLTQAGIAEKMGISRGAYIKLENGDTRPVIDSVLAFSDATGIPLPEIIAGCYPEKSGGLLKEEANYKEHLRQVVDEYEERLAKKNEEIAAQKEMNKVLQQAYDVQRQMLDMYERKSGKKD